jgi:hypothetical protein
MKTKKSRKPGKKPAKRPAPKRTSKKSRKPSRVAVKRARGRASGFVPALRNFYDKHRDKIHTAGKVALGTMAVAGLGYGLKKAHDRGMKILENDPEWQAGMAEQRRRREQALSAKASGLVDALKQGYADARTRLGRFYDENRDKIHTAGKVALGTLTAAGLGYGAYRLANSEPFLAAYEAALKAQQKRRLGEPDDEIQREREQAPLFRSPQEEQSYRRIYHAELERKAALSDSPIRSRLIPVVRKQHHGNPSLEKKLRSGIPDIPPEYSAVVAPGRRPNFRPFATEQPRSTGIADRMGAPATGQYIYPEHRSPARQSEPF